MSPNGKSFTKYLLFSFQNQNNRIEKLGYIIGGLCSICSIIIVGCTPVSVSIVSYCSHK